MKIPLRVKIAGKWFRIHFPYLFNERSDVLGRIDLNRNQILITNIDQAGNICADSQMEVVLYHELVHGIDIAYCMNKIGEEMEKEDIIDSIARGLQQVIGDNFEPLKPKAKCMLTSDKKKSK